jgi:dUTP pyrophosphatase
MIKFEKISYEQFQADWSKWNGPDAGPAQAIYDALKLPQRGSRESAGYDFFAPAAFSLAPGETITIPTGIRAVMDPGVVLLIFPRSGQGVRYKLQLMNTVGVIDADYWQADNQGHILITLYNDHPAGAVLHVERGKGFAQGVFLPHLFCDDDQASAQRTGGFGSTDHLQA